MTAEDRQEVEEPKEFIAARETTGEGLDREQLDRVIRRASELQHAGSDVTANERIPESEVLRIGREVGLDPEHVRRALGELRAEGLLPSTERDTGVLTRLVGPARIGASRVVPGAGGELLESLEGYLERGESLRQVRKRAGRSRWEPAEGLVASLQRGIGWGGRSYDLARIRALEVSVEPLDEESTLVAFVADLSSNRSESGWGWMVGLGTGGGGLGMAVGTFVAGPILIVPGVVLGAAGGVVAARRDYANRLERTRMVLEGILDRLEAGEPLLAEPHSWRDRWLRT